MNDDLTFEKIVRDRSVAALCDEIDVPTCVVRFPPYRGRRTQYQANCPALKHDGNRIDA